MSVAGLMPYKSAFFCVCLHTSMRKLRNTGFARLHSFPQKTPEYKRIPGRINLFIRGTTRIHRIRGFCLKSI
ncbi:hypothetical protein BRYFOR_09735 [Marvinbryantia formatexigens DSM 14469]|uniref:Uncharacterized protein n=1 Tax=Marvinbryantia formatexigens DSM 14469 TaxID=478749 RepID=C6LM36_9FIRM|nr:hypothetical protein BRYFOR_09735 [Marvinbryantia formatexigens DSM 14469]